MEIPPLSREYLLIPLHHLAVTFRYNIPFMCTYPLDYLLTLESETGEKYGHYIPQIYQVQIITILFQNGGEGIGRFPVAMMLFKDESYGPVYSSAPSINVSDTVYVGIILGESPEGAVIQARQCWATPTENPEDPVRVSLIDGFCSDNDETGVNIINNGNSNRAKWTTKAFKFAGPNYDKGSFQSFSPTTLLIVKIVLAGPKI